MCPPSAHGRGRAVRTARVAVLDEYPAVLESVAALLDGRPGFVVTARVQTGADLLAHVQAHHVDVVVAEPWLRSGDGLEALSSIRRSHPDILIIALSRQWNRGHVEQLRGIGVGAYIPKSIDLAQIPGIITSARDGMVTLPSDLPGGSAAHMLTPREAEVLRMAAEGLDNRAIATALAVSERTVKFHLQNTYRKLGVSNRTAASATARRMGIIQ